MAVPGSLGTSDNGLYWQPCHFWPLWQWPSLAAMPLLAMAVNGSHACSDNDRPWQPCHIWQWPSRAAIPLLAIHWQPYHFLRSYLPLTVKSSCVNGRLWPSCHWWLWPSLAVMPLMVMAVSGRHATSSGHVCLWLDHDLVWETMASRSHLAIIAATRTICTIAAFVFMGQSSLAVLLLALGFILKQISGCSSLTRL